MRDCKDCYFFVENAEENIDNVVNQPNNGECTKGMDIHAKTKCKYFISLHDTNSILVNEIRELVERAGIIAGELAHVWSQITKTAKQLQDQLEREKK